MSQNRYNVPHQQPPIQNYGGMAQSGWRCPFCQSNQGAYFISKISTQGWVVVLILLLFCLPLFWIGFTMKEQTYHCRSCRMKLG